MSVVSKLRSWQIGLTRIGERQQHGEERDTRMSLGEDVPIVRVKAVDRRGPREGRTDEARPPTIEEEARRWNTLAGGEMPHSVMMGDRGEHGGSSGSGHPEQVQHAPPDVPLDVRRNVREG